MNIFVIDIDKPAIGVLACMIYDVSSMEAGFAPNALALCLYLLVPRPTFNSAAGDMHVGSGFAF